MIDLDDELDVAAPPRRKRPANRSATAAPEPGPKRPRASRDVETTRTARAATGRSDRAGGRTAAAERRRPASSGRTTETSAGGATARRSPTGRATERRGIRSAVRGATSASSDSPNRLPSRPPKRPARSATSRPAPDTPASPRARAERPARPARRRGAPPASARTTTAGPLRSATARSGGTRSGAGESGTRTSRPSTSARAGKAGDQRRSAPARRSVAAARGGAGRGRLGGRSASKAPRPGGGRSRSARAYRKVSGARMALITLVTLGGFAALLIKLADLQAVSPDKYAEQARDQRLDEQTLPATRGEIVDRNGEPLVTTVTRKTIFTDPANVDGNRVDEMARTLAPLLGVNESTLRERLTEDGNFAYLARKIDAGIADRVMALDYPGVYEIDEATRLKPAGDLAQSVIGSVDTENVGISGVELTFDQLLTGKPGRLVQERSLAGEHTIPDGRREVDAATPGSMITLTLDRNLQQVAEKAVGDAVTAHSAKGGTAVVMDTETGELLALASIGNTAQGPLNDDQNRAITTIYDPGSVAKIVTMAEVIENGLVAPWTVRDVPPAVDFYDVNFRDDSRAQAERMTVTDILARSSNVGTMLLARDLGEEKLAQGIDAFGFGHSTGVGLEHEEIGQVPALADWSGTSLPTLAIGQGFTATPLQVLAAYNTVANGGEYVSPTMVRSIVSPDSDEATRIVANRHRVISEDTATHLQTMLRAVVRNGTGANANVAGYDVAGKTGTAWKARSSGGYGADGDRDYLATFVGFAPAADPKFSIIVVIDEPKDGSYTGGLAAAPVFSTIARQAMLSYDIPPDADGWAQPADGTNLRARAAVAPPTTQTTVRMAATAAEPSTAGGSSTGTSTTGAAGSRSTEGEHDGDGGATTGDGEDTARRDGAAEDPSDTEDASLTPTTATSRADTTSTTAGANAASPTSSASGTAATAASLDEQAHTTSGAGATGPPEGPASSDGA